MLVCAAYLRNGWHTRAFHVSTRSLEAHHSRRVWREIQDARVGQLCTPPLCEVFLLLIFSLFCEVSPVCTFLENWWNCKFMNCISQFHNSELPKLRLVIQNRRSANDSGAHKTLTFETGIRRIHRKPVFFLYRIANSTQNFCTENGTQRVVKFCI